MAIKHHFHHFLGTFSAFCLMIILLITSVEGVCYWTPGYFKEKYTKYQVLNDLPEMSMDDLLQVTDEMMDYLRGERSDLHVLPIWEENTGNFSPNGKSPTWKMCGICF